MAKEESKQLSPDEAKLKALQAAMSKIEKDFGKGSIMKMGDEQIENVEVIPTGSIGLDVALGVGGYPRGRIIEIYGPESSGKTTLAIHAIAEAQKAGGIAAFIDAEHAFDRFYAEKLGVDVANLWISQPDNGEQALEIADQLIRSSAIDILVVDSVAALTPKKEIEGDMGIVVTDFTVSFDGVRKLIYTPDIHLVEIDWEDGRQNRAILKDVQFHPLTDAVLHLDFLEVFGDKPIVMNVPVELVGHAKGVKAGGKLNHAMRRLRVKGHAAQIPEKLIVNVDNLELGKVIKVGELTFENVEVMSPKNAVVCAVKMTRAAQSAAGAEMPTEEAGEESAEGGEETKE